MLWIIKSYNIKELSMEKDVYQKIIDEVSKKLAGEIFIQRKGFSTTNNNYIQYNFWKVGNFIPLSLGSGKFIQTVG
jgi:hypothetical protein